MLNPTIEFVGSVQLSRSKAIQRHDIAKSIPEYL